MLLVVWWSWNYTTWVTNELDPDAIAVRLLLIGLMLASLIMAVAIPEAFGDRGLLFAGAYVVIQVGRHTFLTFARPARHDRAHAGGRDPQWFLAAGVLLARGRRSRTGRRARSCGWSRWPSTTPAAVRYRVPGRPRLDHVAWQVDSATSPSASSCS